MNERATTERSSLRRQGSTAADNMNTNITRKLAGIVALLSDGSPGIGAEIVKRLTPHGGNVASLFVTNGGYNGVQQVVRLSRCFRQRRRRSDCEERLSQDGEDHRCKSPRDEAPAS
jgi:hypothetical protein